MAITVYTKPSCVQCDQTKRFLDKSKIDYSTVDITEDQEAFDKIISLGFKAAPVVITDNDSWAGFNPSKLAKLVEESI
jgi:glutaredoxin-like protein NrdH